MPQLAQPKDGSRAAMQPGRRRRSQTFGCTEESWAGTALAIASAGRKAAGAAAPGSEGPREGFTEHPRLPAARVAQRALGQAMRKALPLVGRAKGLESV